VNTTINRHRSHVDHLIVSTGLSWPIATVTMWHSSDEWPWHQRYMKSVVAGEMWHHLLPLLLWTLNHHSNIYRHASMEWSPAPLTEPSRASLEWTLVTSYKSEMALEIPSPVDRSPRREEDDDDGFQGWQQVQEWSRQRWRGGKRGTAEEAKDDRSTTTTAISPHQLTTIHQRQKRRSPRRRKWTSQLTPHQLLIWRGRSDDGDTSDDEEESLFFSDTD
jgi:hypothetical protein